MTVASAARIRAMAAAGKSPTAIHIETGTPMRTVSAVLERPPTPWEQAEVDRLTSWAPLCMEAADWAFWQSTNPRNADGHFAPRPCNDCPLGFAAEMRAQGKCNGTPGGVEADDEPAGERSLRSLPAPRDTPSEPVTLEHPPMTVSPPDEPRAPRTPANLTAILERLATAAAEAAAAFKAEEAATAARLAAQDRLEAAWRELKGIEAPPAPDPSRPVTIRSSRAGRPPTVEERARLVVATVDRHGGNVSAAAAELDMRPNAVARINNAARARGNGLGELH